MNFARAIDAFIEDWKAVGRINSPATERDYRAALCALADDAGVSPMRMTREDVKRCLRRWPNPNSQRKYRSIFVTFGDWMMEEGYRPDNPARQTRRPKKRKPSKYRLTFEESQRFLLSARTMRERWACSLGICAGVRNAELRGLQGRHFHRPGFVWISSDIGKGSRERYIPIIADLAPTVAEIQERLADDQYVLPAQRWRGFGDKRERWDKAKVPSSSQSLRNLVIRVAKRAGIYADISPHTMRHAFADFISNASGDIRNAQLMLGHSSVGTTQDYLGGKTLDQLAKAVEGVTFGLNPPVVPHTMPESELVAAVPLEAPTGIEPVQASRSAVARVLRALWLSPTIQTAAREMVA